jgi:hypothetical protein
MILAQFLHNFCITLTTFFYDQLLNLFFYMRALNIQLMMENDRFTTPPQQRHNTH